MQKKIIALAVAAAFSAPAFADTTVYGVVDAALVHVSADGQKSDVQAVSSGLAGSRLGFKSVEDLNNGMKAVVVLEYGLDTETSNNAAVSSKSTTTCAVTTGATCTATTTTTSGSATNIAARQQMLAIAGDFGTFATGYLQTTGYDFGSKFNPVAGSAVSPLGTMTNKFLIGDAAVAKRVQRALAYISPDMGGVTVAVNYTTALAGLGNLSQASGATTGLKTSAYLLSATYNGGPLAVGAVYAATKSDNAGANNDKEYALGGSYDLGVAKLFATYQSNTVDNSIGSDKVMSFSAVAPVGPGAVAFSYAKSTIGSTTTADNGKAMTVAYLQELSKTTKLYVALEKVTNDTAATGYSVLNNGLGAITAGGSSTVLALGLNKKF